MIASESVVSLRGVSKRHVGPPPVDALEDVDLEVKQNEWVAVVGPSGSGKSTLLNLLGLLDTPTEGSYHLLGTEVGGLSERRRTALRARHLGFVFQAFHLVEHATAAENVQLGLRYAGARRRARQSEAGAVLDALGLAERSDALARHLSGGERQRVALARALAGRPSLLLCDEPTGNLDQSSAGTVLQLLRAAHAAGTTIVVITHDPQVADAAQRQVQILDGHIGAGHP